MGSQSVAVQGEGPAGGPRAATRIRSATVSAEEWARAMDTIPYEIVCGFSERLPRVYFGGGGDHG